MQSELQMKYKMEVFRPTYFTEQYHVFGIESVENEQNSGILRITRHMAEISLILGLVKLEQMDLAYTHEPSRRIMGLVGTRGLHLYLRTLEAAVEDEIVTDDEMSILRVIARAFALPDDVMSNAWDILRNQIDNPVDPSDVHAHEKRQIGDATTYQTALIAALVDEIITEDEWSMLDVMRRVMGIQPSEHALIEEAVRAMASNVEDGDSFVSRLDRYVTLHPYR